MPASIILHLRKRYFAIFYKLGAFISTLKKKLKLNEFLEVEVE